jgi:hypothetical protein
LKTLLQRPVTSRGVTVPAEVKTRMYSSEGRGVIVPGKAMTNYVRDENYTWSPNPVISVVIRYYRPKDAASAE